MKVGNVVKTSDGIIGIIITIDTTDTKNEAGLFDLSRTFGDCIYANINELKPFHGTISINIKEETNATS